MDQKRNMTYVALLRLNRIDRYYAALPGEETKLFARSVWQTRAHEKAQESND
jgi:hypothetical protein